MTYQEILESARASVGPYCKACPVCNGAACKNTIPGPGAKGNGTGFIRNFQKWQELCLNLDTMAMCGARSLSEINRSMLFSSPASSENRG